MYILEKIITPDIDWIPYENLENEVGKLFGNEKMKISCVNQPM